MTACLFYAVASTGVTDILSVISVSVVSVKESSLVILNDSSYFNSISKLFL